MFGHPGLSLASKLVLLALETFADYPSGANARPGVEGLMQKCGGLSDRAVRNGLTDGRLLGLIEQTGRANPKRGLAAVYRLVSTGTTVPVDGANSTGITVPVETSSSGTGVPVERRIQPAHNGFQPAQRDVSTGTPVPPTNPITPIQNTKARAPHVSNARIRARALIAETLTHANELTTDEHAELVEQLANALTGGVTDESAREALRRWDRTISEEPADDGGEP